LKDRASGRTSRQPDPTIVALDDRLADRKTHSHTAGNGKNQADAKKDAKEKSASRVSARVGTHRYYNYAGRHYGEYRGYHYGWYRR